MTVKVGISYTSVENARQNRQAEARTLTFDEAREESARQWEEMLGRIRVETDRREDKVKFYTGLYHALLGARRLQRRLGRLSEARRHGGPPADEGGASGLQPLQHRRHVGRAVGTDAARVMAYPDHMSDYISSHLQVYKDCGWLADGLACSRFVSGVGTNQLSNMIVATYMAGIRDFDLPLAYEACLKNELGWEDRPRELARPTPRTSCAWATCPTSMLRMGDSTTSQRPTRWSIATVPTPWRSWPGPWAKRPTTSG